MYRRTYKGVDGYTERWTGLQMDRHTDKEMDREMKGQEESGPDYA